MKKFYQIPEELMAKLKKVASDEELANLGFRCKNKLCEYDGYENFYERLFTWVKTEEDKIYIVIAGDSGNGYCTLKYVDLYIREIIAEENEECDNQSKEYVSKLQDSIEELVNFAITKGYYIGDNILEFDSYLHLAGKIKFDKAGNCIS